MHHHSHYSPLRPNNKLRYNNPKTLWITVLVLVLQCLANRDIEVVTPNFQFKSKPVVQTSVLDQAWKLLKHN